MTHIRFQDVLAIPLFAAHSALPAKLVVVVVLPAWIPP